MLHNIIYAAAVPERPDLSESIQEKFFKIFPSWPLMLATLLSLLISIIILYFLLYKPVKKAIKARQDYIQNNINQAEETNKLSQQKLEEVNTRLAKAHEDANLIKRDAKIRAEAAYSRYIEKAKSTSQRMIEEAKIDIQLQQSNLLKESKKEIVTAATNLSRQILEREISQETQDKIIDKFLKES
ncbi:F0F1 ATP synthase subunit B [Mycoplasmopsis opalescens]|uniref:F0F1 ATP synthase subunit B n=1 Tax=Mycoplasmopsis opalescens TaxID=114886 RepID=UPI00068B215D|nr:F0F1 ATP synthase subunit B [Mycoplasmopsis opalescens]